MPISNDLSNVPRATREGLPPSRNPFAVTSLARAWWDKYVNEGAELAIPEAGTFRASAVSKRCDRQMYYSLSGAEPTEPPTIADVWRMELGTLVHRAMQDARAVAHPNGIHEPNVDLRPLGIDGSGHVDVVDGDLLVELKTINGFSFKMIATSFKGAPQGPRYGAVVQAALLAAAINAGGMIGFPDQRIERIVVGYLSLELVGPGMVDVTIANDDDLAREIARFTAEWHFTMDELQPIADYEVARIKRLQRMVRNEMLPTRALHDPEYPTGAIVTGPALKNAGWQVIVGDDVVDSGTTWMCGYCDFRQRCIDDGRGGDSVEVEI